MSSTSTILKPGADSKSAAAGVRTEVPGGAPIRTDYSSKIDPVVERKRLRDFGMVMTLALTVLAGYSIYQGRFEAATWASIVSCFFIIPALGAPHLLAPLERLWMALAEKMSIVMTFLIVALTFFCVLTPIALVGRLFGKQFLAIGFDKSLQTYWEPSDSGGSGSRYYTPY